MVKSSRQRRPPPGRRRALEFRSRSDGEPWPLLPIGGLDGLVGALVLQGARDVVESFQQALLAHGMDLEAMDLALRIRHRLGAEVDADGRARPIPQLLADRFALRIVECYGQQAVLVAVVEV